VNENFAHGFIKVYVGDCAEVQMLTAGASGSSQFASAVAQADAHKKACPALVTHSVTPKTKLPEQLDTHAARLAAAPYLFLEHLSRGTQRIRDQTTSLPLLLPLNLPRRDFEVVQICEVSVAPSFRDARPPSQTKGELTLGASG
jgi:hypothetical protein